jgi:hypothetical protein
MGHQPDNIPAGTQVVSSVPIRGTNDALVHPRGAVGIITRTPTGEENHYLVRFPDGFVRPPMKMTSSRTGFGRPPSGVGLRKVDLCESSL